MTGYARKKKGLGFRVAPDANPKPLTLFFRFRMRASGCLHLDVGQLIVRPESRAGRIGFAIGRWRKQPDEVDILPLGPSPIK